MPTNDNDYWQLHRRGLLGALGAGATFALAGCVGDDGDDDTGADNDDDDDTGDPDSDDVGEDGTGDDPDDGAGGDSDAGDPDDGDPDDADHLVEPSEFPDGEACAVCNMIAAEHPEWNAQLLHEDDERAYFCSAGCLLAYAVDPGHFDGPDADVEGVWVTDYETGDLVDGTAAHYVRVDDPDHVDDIMMMNPTPFTDRDDAGAFVDQLNDDHDAAYDDGDVITFDDFDRDLAMLYRGNFFE